MALPTGLDSAMVQQAANNHWPSQVQLARTCAVMGLTL